MPHPHPHPSREDRKDTMMLLPNNNAADEFMWFPLCPREETDKQQAMLAIMATFVVKLLTSCCSISSSEIPQPASGIAQVLPSCD